MKNGDHYAIFSAELIRLIATIRRFVRNRPAPADLIKAFHTCHRSAHSVFDIAGSQLCAKVGRAILCEIDCSPPTFQPLREHLGELFL